MLWNIPDFHSVSVLLHILFLGDDIM